MAISARHPGRHDPRLDRAERQRGTLPSGLQRVEAQLAHAALAVAAQAMSPEQRRDVMMPGDPLGYRFGHRLVVATPDCDHRDGTHQAYSPESATHAGSSPADFTNTVGLACANVDVRRAASHASNTSGAHATSSIGPMSPSPRKSL